MRRGQIPARPGQPADAARCFFAATVPPAYPIMDTVSESNVQARFIEPMLLRPAATLPPGAGWAYELKLDGFRAVAIKSGGRGQLRSRNNRDFKRKYPSLVQALSTMPDETVFIDGEVVALDSGGRPSFLALQNYNAKSEVPLVYYVFDVMILKPLWVTDSFENRGRSDRADAKDDAE